MLPLRRCLSITAGPGGLHTLGFVHDAENGRRTCRCGCSRCRACRRRASRWSRCRRSLTGVCSSGRRERPASARSAANSTPSASVSIHHHHHHHWRSSVIERVCVCVSVCVCICLCVRHLQIRRKLHSSVSPHARVASVRISDDQSDLLFPIS